MYSAYVIVALLSVWVVSVSAEEDNEILANQYTNELLEQWKEDVNKCKDEKDSLQVRIETKKSEVESQTTKFEAAQAELAEATQKAEQCAIDLERLQIQLSSA